VLYISVLRELAHRRDTPAEDVVHGVAQSHESRGVERAAVHDLRHQCITELLEGGAPEAAVLSIAGHVSRKMMEHYSHIRMEAKRKALERLAPVVAVESEFGAAEPRVH
jgi:integrase